MYKYQCEDCDRIIEQDKKLDLDDGYYCKECKGDIIEYEGEDYEEELDEIEEFKRKVEKSNSNLQQLIKTIPLSKEESKSEPLETIEEFEKRIMRY